MHEENDKIMIELRVRHLEMLQTTISRMSASSASLKSHCLTIATAIIVFAATVQKFEILSFAAPIFLIFAILDARYLSTERAFRAKYDSVRHEKASEMTDFSLSPSWNPDASLFSSLWSWSIWLFYLPIVALLFAIYFFFR